MKRFAICSCAAAALAFTGSAAAINDPFVPAENCAPAHAQAVGHPAAPVLATTPAGLPGPGKSDAGLTHNEAEPNC
jgi:hypothetical protein